ncbi:DNA-processing protein DprA [Nocardioides sp. R-C-SC26]|uniref:DNA-processing protein DprA n=1 Tax=Nocardioides sp. R-C-SC26 TaxID=2870414 RepID=UPI001E3F044D|nr:DNA-processing protein DprA [Nocardioides sp. R-C-SC26]
MIATDVERLTRAALSRLAEPGDVRLTSLVEQLGATRVHDLLVAGPGPAAQGDRRDDQGLADDVATRLVSLDPARELEIAHRQGIRFIIPGDVEWPTGLDDLSGAGALHERGGVPVGLWVRGPARLSEVTSAVAVVGSRAATSYGGAIAGEIAGECATHRMAVVSGGAFGVDIAAHRAALAVGGLTVGVLACGVDRYYPQSNADLLRRIAEVGALVSEAAPGCAPQRVRFLARNRLIAALTAGTVVVEAASRSGALNTANWATRLNRVVMGVPGPVTSETSAGVHEQLQAGVMQLVTGAHDVRELLGRSGEELAPQRPRRRDVRDRLAPRQRQVLDAVPVAGAVPVDSVARVAGLGLLEVQASLTRLARAGLVQQEGGGWRLSGLARA